MPWFIRDKGVLSIDGKASRIVHGEGEKIVRFFLIALILISLTGCASVQEDWRITKTQNSKSAYSSFLSNHPDSEYSAEARIKIDEFVWLKAKQENRVFEYEKFIKYNPNNIFVSEAIKNIKILEWESAKKDDTIESYEKFLKKYPAGSYATKATDSIARIKKETELKAFQSVSNSKIRAKLIQFLNDYPKSEYREKIQERLSLFSSNTLAKPLLLPYEELGLNNPMSGEEAKEKFRKQGSMNIIMPVAEFKKDASSIIVLHKDSKFPGIIVGTIYGGKLNLSPSHYYFPDISPPDNKHGYFIYSLKLLLPVGTEFSAPKDKWIQWKNVEFKGGSLKFLEEGVEFSAGMEITKFKE
uniref:Outer membrane lipoprotein BamD-like domain-containing protein n=1 Tax=uncultured Desulfobacterium sp. TaxID=201089 RepID=E1YKS0_9BACT|nr:hypothetical protein N47_E42150 [uncultured Desulfobacterium sp.]